MVPPAAEDGHLGQVVLGHDAARQGYWASYDGKPGLAFLLGPFAKLMAERGLGAEAQHTLFVTAPAA